MNKKILLALVLVVVGSGILFALHSRYLSTGSKTVKDIQSKYDTIQWPKELRQTSVRCGVVSCVYFYSSSASRDQTYKDLNTLLDSHGYGPGGQTGEFIFTNGGDLKFSITLNPADTSQPMSNVQIIAEEPAQL